MILLYKLKSLNFPSRDPEGNELPKSAMNRVTFFQKKQKKDTIDVWWLSDDGGIFKQKKKKRRKLKNSLFKTNFSHCKA